MGLRDYLIAPPRDADAPDAFGLDVSARDGLPRRAADAPDASGLDVSAPDASPRREADASDASSRRDVARSARGLGLRPARRTAAEARVPAPSFGVLAPAGSLAPVAAGVGLVIARWSPAALVCLHAAVELDAPALRVPARSAAARLAASLAARDLRARACGRLVFVCVAADGDGPALAARALAAAGALPTVLGVAARDPGIDVVLAAQHSLLVALAPSADPAFAELALAGANELARSATAVALTIDPISRALALAGVRAPTALARAVGEALA
jgi:hypothetical protein